MDITVTTPDHVTDLWAYARQLTGEEWAGDGDDSPWSVTLTGATDTRDTFVSTNVGLDLIRNVVATIDVMGGPSKLKEVVALEAEYFFLQDTQGRLWDIYARRSLTTGETQSYKDLYDEMYQANNSSQATSANRAAWNTLLYEDGLSLQRVGFDWMSLTRPDGSLDLQRFKDVFTEQLSSATVFPDGRGCAGLCVTNNGHIHGSRQAHHGGYPQRPRFFGRSGENFKMPTCAFNATINRDAPIGCGPSAFIGLVWRKWVDGHKVLNKFYSGPSPRNSFLYDPYPSNHIAYDMTAPGRSDVRPLTAVYMGTCYFINGGMTTGQQFRDGGRRFLSAHAPTLSLKANVSEFGGNTVFASQKANMLRENIGRKNNPVVAEYFTGGFPGMKTGHFSPVEGYRIYNGLTIGVNITTMDHPNRWHSLSAAWGLQRGVFFLD